MPTDTAVLHNSVGKEKKLVKTSLRKIEHTEINVKMISVFNDFLGGDNSLG